MARKPHKYAHNGVSLSTVLSETDLRAICGLAAVESTGDLWNGKQKIEQTGSGAGWTSYLIKDGLLGWSKLLNFSVTVGAENGRTSLETEILTYMTSQPTMYGIPAGTKKMVAHHTYMQFVHKVANTVREADASATVRISEGVLGAGPAGMVSTSSTPPPPLQASPPPPPPPAQGPPAPPPSAGPPPPPALESVAPVDLTQRVIRTPRRPGAWMLAPQGLPERALGALTYLGRDPRALDAGADLVSVPVDEFTVSKTHAAIELIGGVVYITDLDSTNGTFLVDRFDDMVQCEPRVRTQIPPGFGIELGAYSVAFVQKKMEPSR